MIPTLLDDAKNRALRTFIQGLIVAVMVDVWPIVSQALQGESTHWMELGKAAVRVALLAAGSFVMRRWADAAKFIPTPLPPTPQPPPATRDPAP